MSFWGKGMVLMGSDWYYVNMLQRGWRYFVYASVCCSLEHPHQNTKYLFGVQFCVWEGEEAVSQSLPFCILC